MTQPAPAPAPVLPAPAPIPVPAALGAISVTPARFLVHQPATVPVPRPPGPKLTQALSIAAPPTQRPVTRAETAAAMKRAAAVLQPR